MKEIVYTFDNRGCYLPDKTETFEKETLLRLVIKPHKFELRVSDEVLRSSSCEGYVIEASCKGGVSFYDKDNKLLAMAEDNQSEEFAQIKFSWKQEQLSVEFGCKVTVDYYPNCDGESDRWGEEWVTKRAVLLNLKTNAVEIE